MSSDPVFLPVDSQHMHRAIYLARRGCYTCMPNPRVGCVITNRQGEVIGEGWHHQTGQPHAEVNALKTIVKPLLPGSTAYVTLEPCCHHGKTPPCVEALIGSGISRVIIGMEDPNPQVAGKGILLLKQAGIQVEVGLLNKEVQALNRGFIRRMNSGLPYVFCKMAMSLDARTAMKSGDSKWITSKDARLDVQRLRGQSCVVITGVQTILFDDPAMTFRPEELDDISTDNLPTRQPLRVVIDSQLRTPITAKIFSLSGPVLVVCSAISEEKREKFLNKVGATRANYHLKESSTEVLSLPNEYGQVDLSELIKILGKRNYNEVMFEAGATLAGAAIQSGIIDEIKLYVAPLLMGSTACPLFNLPIDKMSDKIQLRFQEVRSIGQDFCITALLER